MKKQKDSFSKVLLIIALLFILGGSVIFLYPTVSNYLAEKNSIDVIKNYDEMVVNIDDSSIEAEFEKAQIYNENLSGEPVHDPFVEGTGYALPKNYTEVLNITDDGIMAYIDIPKISVYLPIYHGTSEEVLEKGVGHIQSTSLPIGGNSTHSILTGHTGLPSAELFTRLDELVIGDIFYIHVLNEVLTYKVYETKIILPDDISELQITSGKDYITLVTCTPYGVNSHRLLVKAERTEYEEYVETTNKTEETSTENSANTKLNKSYYLTGMQIGIFLFIIILLILLVLINIKKLKGGKHLINNNKKKGK